MTLHTSGIWKIAVTCSLAALFIALPGNAHASLLSLNLPLVGSLGSIGIGPISQAHTAGPIASAANAGKASEPEAPKLPDSPEPPKKPALPKPADDTSSKRGMVSIDIDDGWQSTYVNAMPIIDAAGFKTSQFIITSRVGMDGIVTKDELLKLQSEGHDIENHTETHPHLTTLSADELAKEIDGARNALLAMGLRPVVSFAYPFGEFNNAVVDAVKRSGALSARTTASGLNDATTDPYKLSAESLKNTTTFAEIKSNIDKAVSTGSWYILTIHHVDDPSDDYNISSDLLKQIVSYLKENNVKVVTNTEGTRILASENSK